MWETQKTLISLTSDNSHTLYVPELDETYHSTHGAIQEAVHVFIKNGIGFFNQKKVSVLEVGFGTGLNGALTFSYAKRNRKQIKYVGLETFPLELEIIKELNYSIESKEITSEDFYLLHEVKWEREIEMGDFFSIHKINRRVQDFDTTDSFDVIYYDAFGPRAQPEMWDIRIFEKLYKYLNPGGRLVTYCARGQFKRDLKACGYEVVSLPGPPGKREMTVAIKK